jgi:hypothetical protein
MRALIAGLTVVVVLAVGSDLGQYLRAPHASAAALSCCCGPAGDPHGCECTGPCCDHGPGRARDRAFAGFDAHCATRQAAPPGATTLLPGTPVAARVSRLDLPAVVAPGPPADRVAARGPSAPSEPPPRTRAA